MDPLQYQPHTPHQIPTPPHDSPVDEKPSTLSGDAINYPTINPQNKTQGLQNQIPDSIKNKIPDSIKNMQIPESVKNVQVPAAVKNAANGAQSEYRKTTNEFSTLAARVPGPSEENEPEQYLTHFHNFFYDLFTWKFPRATALSFIVILTVTITSRYVNILRYVFKGLCYLFAASAGAEFAGKPLGMQGFVSQIRPRRYYIVPRDAIEAVFAEIHELLNFFVLEFQRLLFAEDIFATIVAFVSSFIGYFLIKYISAWTLFLTATIIAYTAPLMYLSNQEVIDEQIRQLSNIVNEKLTVARNVSEKYATEAAQQARATANQLSDRVSELTGSARQSVNAALPKAQEVANNATFKAKQSANIASEKVRNVAGMPASSPVSTSTVNRQYKAEDFPEPPHNIQRVELEPLNSSKLERDTESPMLI